MAGTITCIRPHCGAPNELLPGGLVPSQCVACGLCPDPQALLAQLRGETPANAAKPKRVSRTTTAAPQPAPRPIGQPVLGVDPGARYTGVVLRDGDAPLYASTLVREKDRTDPVEWARLAVATIREIHATVCPPGTPLAVEGVEAPKGFANGQKAPINPGPILFAGVVLGAVAASWPNAVIIPPGKNGSRGKANYPTALVGRRPADLPGSSNGAGTRDHEQSAYDVAGRGALVLYPRAT